MNAGGLDSPPRRLGIELGSVNMISSLLPVARTAPASEDGVQLGGVKRPCVLTCRAEICVPRAGSGALGNLYLDHVVNLVERV